MSMLFLLALVAVGMQKKVNIFSVQTAASGWGKAVPGSIDTLSFPVHCLQRDYTYTANSKYLPARTVQGEEGMCTCGNCKGVMILGRLCKHAWNFSKACILFVFITLWLYHSATAGTFSQLAAAIGKGLHNIVHFKLMVYFGVSEWFERDVENKWFERWTVAWRLGLVKIAGIWAYGHTCRLRQIEGVLMVREMWAHWKWKNSETLGCTALQMSCFLDLEQGKVYRGVEKSSECLRPYHVENTSSRPITEVKQRRARLVLGWVTAWEYRVL